MRRAAAASVGMRIPATSAGAGPLYGGVDPARIRQIAIRLGDKPFAFGPRIDDREAWAHRAGMKAYAGAIADAERALGTPLPEMTDAIYRQFKETGLRTREYAQVRAERYGRIGRFTFAECIENRGRFLPAIEALLRSLCAEKTWIYAYHDPELANLLGKRMDIDLSSSRLAQDLGQCLYLLGERLSPEVRRLVVQRLRERIFTPYRNMVEGTTPAQWWITFENNWNPVCHSGVVLSALAVLEDREEKAFFIAAAEKYSRCFVDGFGGDGYCSEGLGYWNYGFSFYVLLCETIFQSTGGTVDLYEVPGAREAALYPVRAEIVDGVYPAFADCSLTAAPDPHLLAFINRRYQVGLKDTIRSEDAAPTGQQTMATKLMYTGASSATARPIPAGRDRYEIRTVFADGKIYTGRPRRGSECRLAVSIKGNHNDESHNHNDLGSYVVVVNGEAVLLDPGAEVYTARTFGPHRYQSQLINSFGHPVPVVAGRLQRAGRDARAVIVAQEFTDDLDIHSMDLRSAYEAKELTALKRAFMYSRLGEGSLKVRDEFAFSSPQRFGSALLTYGRWQRLSATELLVTGRRAAVKVAIDAGGVPVELKAGTIKEDTPEGSRPLRIGIDLARPLEAGALVLTITPAAVP